MLRLRGGWTVVDPAIARKARKRLIRTVTAAQAVAAALTGVVEVEDAPAEVVVGASLLRSASSCSAPRPRRRSPTPAGAARRPCATTSATGFTWLDRADLARPRRLPGRRHGPGQDRHPDRAAPAPRARGRPRPDAGGLPGLAARQLGGRDPTVRARRRRTPLPRRQRSLDDLRRPTRARPGFVLTTYGTMRRDAADAGRRSPWGLVVADEAQHVKNAALRDRPGAAHDPVARPASR